MLHENQSLHALKTVSTAQFYYSHQARAGALSLAVSLGAKNQMGL